MLLKAVELPRLIKARTTKMDSENSMALSGIGVPRVTTYSAVSIMPRNDCTALYPSEPSRERETAVARERPRLT